MGEGPTKRSQGRTRCLSSSGLLIDSSTSWVAVRLAGDLGVAGRQLARHPLKFISEARGRATGLHVDRFE